jgi:hypothetical protein
VKEESRASYARSKGKERAERAEPTKKKESRELEPLGARYSSTKLSMIKPKERKEPMGMIINKVRHITSKLQYNHSN